MASSAGSTAPSGTFTIATLRVRMPRVGGYVVRFSFSAWRETALTSGGQPALGAAQGALINVRDGLRLHLPVILKP